METRILPTGEGTTLHIMPPGRIFQLIVETHHRRDVISLARKNQHVTPHPGGGWQVKGAGNKKATARTPTQAEAIDIARNIAQGQKSEVVIHNQQGQIRDKDSYGNDPCPPKDTKH